MEDIPDDMFFYVIYDMNDFDFIYIYIYIDIYIYMREYWYHGGYTTKRHATNTIDTLKKCSNSPARGWLMVIFSANMAMSTTKNSDFFQTRCLISQCHIDTYQLPQRYPDFGLHGSSWWITPEIRKWVPPGMWSDSGISKVGRVQNSRWVEKKRISLTTGRLLSLHLGHFWDFFGQVYTAAYFMAWVSAPWMCSVQSSKSYGTLFH